MEQQNISPMSGANIDPDTFRRVWDRVMPDQTYSPLEVEPPAQPSVSEGGSELPPVPVCPAAEGGGEQPSQPESPGLPGEPETPESPLCLGEHSQPYAQRLEELMTLAQAGIAAGQQLSRRAAGSCAKALASLTADHRRGL